MEFITLKEIILGFVPENKKDLEGALADLLTCDPDYLKLGGRKVAFIENKGIVVTVKKLHEKAMIALTNFFDKDGVKGVVSIDSTWAAFNNTTNAIAYRGGSGYLYSIWKLKGFDIK